MKVTELKDEDKALLADLFTMPHYKSLKKLMEAWRLELAITGMRSAQDMEQLSHFRGQDYMLVQLHKLLKENNKSNVQAEEVS